MAAIVLGAWLGAGAFADFAVTQNFETVDRFLQEPGSNMTLAELTKIGADRVRPILRRNAGEENNHLFADWENVELLAGATLIALLFVGGMRSNLALSLAGAMLFIVAAQRVFLSPEVADLGRRIADLPASDPLNRDFWRFHNIYSGSEILKLLIGLGLAVLLAMPKKREDAGPRPSEPELIAGQRNRGA
jgi:hypothetical protein